MNKRIYIVEDTQAKVAHLVNAQSQGAALRHVVKSRFTSRVAKQSDCIEMTKAGAIVEDVPKRKE